jgi:hypothetical protein
LVLTGHSRLFQYSARVNVDERPLFGQVRIIVTRTIGMCRGYVLEG